LSEHVRGLRKAPFVQVVKHINVQPNESGIVRLAGKIKAKELKRVLLACLAYLLSNKLSLNGNY